jgi:hypothetical protein
MWGREEKEEGQEGEKKEEVERDMEGRGGGGGMGRRRNSRVTRGRKKRKVRGRRCLVQGQLAMHLPVNLSLLICETEGTCRPCSLLCPGVPPSW